MRLAALALSLFALARPAFAVQGYIYGPSLSTTTGIATEYFAGKFYMSASSKTVNTQTITLDGTTGNITTGSSVTASGYFGDGSHLTGLPGTLSGGNSTSYVKWTGGSTVGNAFTSETSTGVTISANAYVTGLLSVGTTNQTYPLTVKGGSPFLQGLFTQDGVNGLYLTGDGGGGTKNWNIGQEFVTNGLAFTPSTVVGGATFSTPVMALQAAGNVGIGNTSPAAKLDVTGALNVRSVKITSPNTAGQSFGPLITAGTNASDEGLNIQNAAGSPLLFVRGDGNIGIGTSSPGSALDVTGTIRQSSVKSCAGGLQTDSSGGITSCNTGSGSGNVITTSTQTFSGANTFVSSAIVANGGILAIGDATAATMYRNNGIVFYAKSVDALAQSSGCVGALQASADTTAGVLTWTSTTTLNGSDLFANHITAGVLLDPGCAPGAFCRFGMVGMYFVPFAGTGLNGQYVGFSATRCAVNGTTNVNAAMGNGMINGEDTDNPVYIYKWK